MMMGQSGKAGSGFVGQIHVSLTLYCSLFYLKTSRADIRQFYLALSPLDSESFWEASTQNVVLRARCRYPCLCVLCMKKITQECFMFASIAFLSLHVRNILDFLDDRGSEKNNNYFMASLHKTSLCSMRCRI